MTASVEVGRAQSLVCVDRATLGEVCTFKNGGTPTKAKPEYFEGDIPWITGADISSPIVNEARYRITQSAVTGSATNVVPRGSILLVTRTSVGKVATAGMELAFSQDITSLHPNAEVLDSSYLRHFLMSKADYFKRNARGATIVGITREVVTRLSIPLPPLEEQRRIAAILDKVDELRTKRRLALEQLETFTQSLFHTIFDHPIAVVEKWPTVTLESVALQITDGEHQTPLRQSSGIKLLSARNVRNGRLDVSNVDYIDMPEYERISRRCKPQRDDVLISCSGSIGRVAVVDTDEKFSLVRSVALVRPNPEKLLPKFLEQQLLTPRLQHKMSQSANTSSQANLFQGPIRKLPIVLPPIELQRDFVNKASAVECLKDQHRSQLVELGALFASLQDRAFKGEL